MVLLATSWLGPGWLDCAMALLPVGHSHCPGFLGEILAVCCLSPASSEYFWMRPLLLCVWLAPLPTPSWFLCLCTFKVSFQYSCTFSVLVLSFRIVYFCYPDSCPSVHHVEAASNPSVKCQSILFLSYDFCVVYSISQGSGQTIPSGRCWPLKMEWIFLSCLPKYC